MVLHQQVEQFWATEKHGFAGECDEIVEDREALESVERTTSVVNGKYEVSLLWKNENPRLPNNLALAERSLQKLKKKFQRKPEYPEHYKSVMNNYDHKGYARKWTPEEAAAFRM